MSPDAATHCPPAPLSRPSRNSRWVEHQGDLYGLSRISASGVRDGSVFICHHDGRDHTFVLRFSRDPAGELGHPIALFHADDGAIYDSVISALTTTYNRVDGGRLRLDTYAMRLQDPSGVRGPAFPELKKRYLDNRIPSVHRLRVSDD